MNELLNQFELDIFISDYLHVCDWKFQFLNDKFKLLKLLTRRYGTHPKFAFQNVTFASSTPEKRVFTKLDCKIKCLSGRGGVCIEHNYFFACFLCSIGYNAYVAGTSVSLIPQSPLCHPVVLIRMEDSGDTSKLLLVDFGMAAPFPFEPIPIDDLPYSYMAGGFLVEYRMNHGICQRVHIKGDTIKGAFPDKTEEVRSETDLTPMAFEDFGKFAMEFCKNLTCLQSLIAFRYLDTNDDSDEYTAVMILCRKLCLITKSSMTVYTFDTYEDMLPSFAKYFPYLSLEELRNSINTFNLNFPVDSHIV